ncbi:MULTISPECIES: hypothetical protein [Cupriavidus]
MSSSVSSPSSRRRAGGGVSPASAANAANAADVANTATGLPPLPADAAVPPPWGTNFDVRESLEAMRTAAVKRHLAAIGPGQARTLRHAQQRSLMTGLLGGGVVVLALWLGSLAWRGNEPPAASVAHAPAVPAAGIAVTAPVTARAAEAAPSEPVAVPAVSAHATVSPPAAAGVAEVAEASRSGAAARTSSAAMPAAARQSPVARPAPPRLVASRAGLRPAAGADEDPGDEIPGSDALDGWPRPSAAAYLPPDTPFELPAHTRLSGG